MSRLDSFKAYDVRGRIPDEINESLAYDIGRAYAAFVQPRQVAVGYDIRRSSPELAAALKRGLRDLGVDVLDAGMIGRHLRLCLSPAPPIPVMRVKKLHRSTRSARPTMCVFATTSARKT